MEEKEFDLDAMQAEFDAEWNEDEEIEEETEEEENSSETLDNEDVEEEESETDDSTELTPEFVEGENDKDTEQNKSFPTEKQNAAFAQMRREKQELEARIADMSKLSGVMEQIAKANGLSPDELVQRYEMQQLQAEAEKQNVPVEYLEKQRQLESKLTQIEEERSNERFNFAVSQVVEKYNLSTEDVTTTITYAVQNGIDLNNPNINFEAVYKMANFDNILESKVKESRQKQLEEKQKRMKGSTIPHGDAATQEPNVDDDVEAFLKEAGLYD